MVVLYMLSVVETVFSMARVLAGSYACEWGKSIKEKHYGE